MSQTNQKTQSPNRKGAPTTEMPNSKGLALVWLTLWLGFLVILLMAVVATANWTKQSGQQILTRQCLNNLAQALLAYKQDKGEFPPTVASTAELVKLLKSTPQAQPHLAKMAKHVFDTTSKGPEILDAWSRPLKYVLDSQTGHGPELKSQGPDPNDPADDIYAEQLQDLFIAPPPKKLIQ